MSLLSRGTTGGGMPETTHALIDPQGRRLDYLRLAVTDRCNLRCRYCMPAAGVPLLPRKEILSLEELHRLVALFCQLGVRKIRITGGEPLVREGVAEWMGRLAADPTRPELLLTTNGTRLLDALPALKRAGLRRVNLSLDTLDETNFVSITRREGFQAVRNAIDATLEAGFGLKVNVVVQPGVNDHELADLALLTRDLPLAVRFIEPMPFSGSGGEPIRPIAGEEILRRLRERFELQETARAPSAVDRIFTIPGHAGEIGIIEGHTRSFCGDCSRLRIDPRGRMRTCLYGAPQAELGDRLREGASDEDLIVTIRDAVARRAADGVEAQAHRDDDVSMVSIGG
jgi:cyclic pyranopterin phosphate synthase